MGDALDRLGGVLSLAVGNLQWNNAAITVLMIAGFAPAAVAMPRRGPVDAVETPRVPVTA